MPTNFRHPKRKIASAREHVKALQQASRDFFALQPYADVIELDPTGTKKVHKIRVMQELPDRVFDLVDRTVSDLRVALDRSCYATCESSDAKHAFFPIADSLKGLMDVIGRGRCKDIKPEILAHLLSLEPYKRIEDRGNDFIWAINRLNNTDKHRNIEPYGINSPFESHREISWSGNPNRGAVEFGSYWDSSKHELIVLTADAGIDLTYDISVRFCIAFKDIDGLNGCAVIPFLQDALNEIERVVLSIEAEAIRLRLIPEI